MENITLETVKKAADGGLPALKDLAEKVPKEQAAVVIGMLVICGVAYKTIEIIKDIMMNKL